MTAYYNEYEPFAAEWLRRLMVLGLIPSGEVDERSILDVSPDDLRGFTQCHFFAGIGGWAYALRLAGWPDDRPVWTGSPPCQPFSSAGRRLGKDDERHLAPHFVGLVRACRPAVLFGEQVASADVFGGAAKRPRNSVAEPPQWAWLDDLSDRLEAARYAVGAVDLPAAGVGAPHIRQRTFFGAIRLADALPAGRTERGTGAGDGPIAGGGRDDGLADAQRGERGQGGLCGLRQADGAQGGRAAAELAGSRDDCGLADADDAGSQGRTGVSERPDQRAARAGSLEGGVADAAGGRHQSRQRNGGICSADTSAGTTTEQRGAVRASCSTSTSSPPDSPWRDADWLYCRDDRWRPVEPGTFPLAHGVPGRVGRLRAYGNAIVPQAAAEVIKAFMEVAA